MAHKSGVEFPVGYNLDPVGISRTTGAFYDSEGGFLHAAGFIVSPDGRTAMAVYSTGPLGRLTPEDSLAWIKFKMGQ